MTKLYEKSEITFAILWIAAYVVLSSLADQLSETIGVMKSVTAALHMVMSLILFFWRKHQAFTGEIFLAYIAGYGLGRLWVEALRTDSLLIPGTSLAVSQCIAGICFVTASILIVLGRKKKPESGG